MRALLVANPKGGSGKTTLATHFAAWLAWQGVRVTLGDMDRQQSSLHWLGLRPEHLPSIRAWDAREEDPPPPKQTDWVVIDSPAGLHGKRLAQAVRWSDRIIVPVQPSSFDMWATEDFLHGILEEKAIRKQKTEIAVVGMRVDPRTRAATLLEEFLSRLDLPVLTYLRDTQNYVHVAGAGRTLFDVPRARVERDMEQWTPLVRWATAAVREFDTPFSVRT